MGYIKTNMITYKLAIAAAWMFLISGCSASPHEPLQGTAEHEVLTLSPVDPDKMMITLRGIDGVQIWEMEKGIEERFTDVDIVASNNTWLQADLANDCYQDIILVSNSAEVNWKASEKFVDLSGERFTQNYYLSAMWENAIEDGLFLLPGPSNIYGIVYNKDMFSQFGWEPPSGLSEFIELCRTIDSSGIRAIQPALYYSDASRQFFTGFTYEPVFAGMSNHRWLEDYKAGRAVMKGHMEPAFEIMQRFIDAGILRTEDYDVRPSTRSDMMYVEQSCAMILETQDAVKYRVEYGGADCHEIGMLPFFSGNGPDSDYLLSVPTYYIAANKRLKQPGNEEKLARVMEIFDYISTPEGQRAVTSTESTCISSIRGAQWGYNDFLEGVKDTIEKGNVVSQVFFVGDSATVADRTLKEDMALFSKGSITADKVMQDLDQARDLVLSQADSLTEAVVIGIAEENFTVLQTAQLFADIFRERAGAQIGMCKANSKAGGCFFKLYKGELTMMEGGNNTINYYIEEGFPSASGCENKEENKLLKVSMTGANLVNALNVIYAPQKTYPDAYWVTSGLKITFAPWADGKGRIVSVKLKNGEAIHPEELYTVAFWGGSVDPALFTRVEACYDDSAEELFRSRVESVGRIKPELDEDFILMWDE